MSMGPEETVRFEREGTRVECVPAFRELRVESFPWQEEEALREEAEVVKISPIRTVIRIRFRADGRDTTLFVKRYRFGDLRRQIKTALGQSRARNEWTALRATRAAGVDAPRPVMVAVRRVGLLRYESYLATVGIEGAEPADEVIGRLKGDERRHAFRLLGRLVAALHERGIFHDDLKAPHIMLTGGRLPAEGLEGVILVDLYNCVVGRRPSMRRRGVNLSQVLISLPGVTRTDQARMLVGAIGSGRKRERRRLWRSMQVALASRRRRRARLEQMRRAASRPG